MVLCAVIGSNPSNKTKTAIFDIENTDYLLRWNGIIAISPTQRSKSNMPQPSLRCCCQGAGRIRFACAHPLVITKDQADFAADTIEDCLKALRN